MHLVRARAFSLVLLVALAGCGASAARTAPFAPPQAQPGGPGPSSSSAAQHILANVQGAGAARAPSGWSGEGDDDGGRGQLVLPALGPCGGGTYATDCGVWTWGSGRPTRGGSTASGTPPALNFCSDFVHYPGDLAPPATPLFGLSTYAFALTYTGTKPAPIGAFATRWWNVSFTGGFGGTSTSASVQLAPVLTGAASRGWLVFFTWTWPADVLLVPYAINEIQVPATAAPLAVPPNGSAPLGAFDCLGRGIAAQRIGNGFGFGADQRGAAASPAGQELSATVFSGANPAGAILLSDDRGARTLVPVVPASPGPTAPPTSPPGR